MSKYSSWTNKQVLKWLSEIPDEDIPAGKKPAILKVAKTDGLTGKHLKEFESKADVKGTFTLAEGVKPAHANIIWAYLKKLKNKEMMANYKNTSNSSNSNKNEKEFEIEWRNGMTGAAKHVSTIKFTESTAFQSAYDELMDHEGWILGKNPEFILSSKKFSLDATKDKDGKCKTLKELGIKASSRGSGAVIINIAADLKGGSNYLDNKEEDSDDDDNERCFTPNYIKKHKILQNMLSFDADCLTFEDDDNELRAKMTCGHVISPNSMFNYINFSLEQNEKVTQIFCPIIKCKKEWEFDLCSIVACMTDKEYQKYLNIIDKRAKSHLVQCPKCTVYLKRPENLTHIRVKCGKGCPDFCSSCSKKWNKSSMTVCGNIGCATMAMNKLLADCLDVPLQKDGGGKWRDGYDTKIPEFRACVHCLTLIKYSYACKHMTCKKCNKKFCFSCLGKYDANKGWTCGSHYEQCKIAPKQQF